AVFLAASGFAATSIVDAAPPAPRRTSPSSTGVKPGVKTPPAAPPTQPAFDPPPLPPNGKKPPVPPLPPKLLPDEHTEPADAPEPPTPGRDDDATAPTPKAAQPAPRTASETPYPPDENGKYLLRYSFSTGETVRWQVEHRAKIVTSVQGSTQAAD